jgi:hypothetical protein
MGDKKLEAPAPYIELKSGKVVDAKKVNIQYGVFGIGSGILADGTKYKPKKVAFFSTGKTKYACVGRKPLICPEVVAGKINLYRYMYQNVEFDPKTGRTHTHTHTIYFMQGENEKEVSTITYKHLNQLIPHDAKANKQLERYEKTHKVCRAGKISGGVLMAGGIGMMAGGSVGTGAVAFSIGLVDYISFGIANMVNRLKLVGAIKAYNEE